MKQLSEELLNAYKATTYRVSDPEFDIRIGKLHPSLDRFMEKSGHSTWAFITAWNPKSQELSIDENRARSQALTDRLKSHELSVYNALGIPDKGDWTPEESLLILGIPRKQAIELGEELVQNAIVFGEFGKRAEILVLSP